MISLLTTRIRITIARGFLLGVLMSSGAQAGTITGTVQARGPEEQAGLTGNAAYQSRRYKFVEKIDYEALTDFVVNIEELVAPPLTPMLAKIIQRDATFEPHVMPLVVGTTVRWPNDDEIFHNVFTMAETKQINLGFYKKERVPEVVFDRLGRLDFFCAIHSNMHCIVLVLPNPYFAVADAKRHFVIKNVPAGKYRLRAWHERMPSQVKEVTVTADGETKIDFVLGVAELPKN